MTTILTTTRTLGAGAGLAAGLVAPLALAAPAEAAAPITTTTVDHVTGPLDSCDGFDVLGDLTLTSRTTTYADGLVGVHLRLAGTVASSTTGLTGRYAEIQVDRTAPSGSGFSAGLLGRLTVPGRGTAPVYAGRVTFAPDGSTTFTPHTDGVADGQSFHDQLCGALS